MITRADLSPGLQAAQCVHAAFALAREHPDEIEHWWNGSSTLVLLSVPDEAALVAWAEVVRSVPAVLVREPDLEEEATALAVAPSPCGSFFASLPLVGKELAMT